MRSFNALALSAAALFPGAADGFISSAGVLPASTIGRTMRTRTAASIAAAAAGGRRGGGGAGATALRITKRQSSSAPPMMMMASYKEQLRAAQEAKAAAARGDSPSSPSSPREPPSGSPPKGGNAAAATLPQVAESPFSEDLQEELRVAITTLTARLQRAKPMTRTEFERFESAVATIVEDALPRQELPVHAVSSGAANAAAPPPTAKAPRRLAVVQSSVPPSPPASAGDDNDDDVDGPQWDAQKVQYGLPQGARNTYSIDDMEKMSPDEYQAALREKVIKRAQSVRKTGSYGNMVSNEYLKFLGKNPKTGDEAAKSNEEFVKRKGNEDFRAY